MYDNLRHHCPSCCLYKCEHRSLQAMRVRTLEFKETLMMNQECCQKCHLQNHCSTCLCRLSPRLQAPLSASSHSILWRAQSAPSSRPLESCPASTSSRGRLLWTTRRCRCVLNSFFLVSLTFLFKACVKQPFYTLVELIHSAKPATGKLPDSCFLLARATSADDIPLKPRAHLECSTVFRP